MCFINEQVPWPHSNINGRFYTSRLCMKMLSFLFVRAWAMPRILYLSCGVPFPISIQGVDQICFLQHQNPSWNTWDIKFLSVALLSQARKSECGMAHNSLVDLIFVRTVNIPNFSLLPCLEVAWCMMHDEWCMMHDAWCNTLVDLIFVRAFSIPKLNFIPCFEVAKFFFDKLTNETKLTNGQSHILKQHAA